MMAAQSAAGALHIFAPVCASWTRISRGTSWRTFINPFGDLSSGWVRDANLMVSRPAKERLCMSLIFPTRLFNVWSPSKKPCAGWWCFCWFQLLLIPHLLWSSPKDQKMCFPTTHVLAGWSIGFVWCLCSKRALRCSNAVVQFNADQVDIYIIYVIYIYIFRSM